MPSKLTIGYASTVVLMMAFAALVAPVGALADAVIQGLGAGTTGGAGGAVVEPDSLAALKLALCSSTDAAGACTDSTPRIVRIHGSYDYRGSLKINGAATTTETGCVVRACTNPAMQPQKALDRVDFCAGRTPTPVTYDNAGIRQLLNVGSNKTLEGVGADALIQGTGLMIRNAQNVIVKNLSITDINPEYVWGGDAIRLDNTDHVWLDHLKIARIGRQMLVTGYGAARHVTVSNSEFDGVTTTSASCDNHHYWLWLFLGSDDTLTLVDNYIHDTSGRGPHSGGLNNATIRAQIVNNYFKDLSREGAIMSRTDKSSLLVEGNVFDNVSRPIYIYRKQPGPAFAPMTEQQGVACQAVLGRACASNLVLKAQGGDQQLDGAVLAALQSSAPALVTPMPASAVQAYVLQHAGPGKP